MSSRRTSSHPAAEAIIDELARCGLRHLVLSPGSRSAPIVIAAHHHPAIHITVALDERSAAHIALGMTIKDGAPVAVLSTSGTAAINHGPALAEAHFAGHPIISITADRGPETRHRGHGQTARQPGLFAPHVAASFDLDETTLDASALRTAVRGVWRHLEAPDRQPVHINVPFDEPLYDTAEATDTAAMAAVPPAKPAAAELPDEWMDFLGCHAPRVLLLAGPDADFWRIDDRSELLKALGSRLAVWADRLSGLPTDWAEEAWLLPEWPADLAPDVVITTGLPPMSKHLRRSLGDTEPVHLHIGPRPKDIWGRGVSAWPVSTATGLMALAEALPAFNAFAEDWQVALDRQSLATAEPQTWSDHAVFTALADLLATRPPASIHFANSTAARLLQKVNWPQASRLHANRGVAGIDGCTSTAVGDALRHLDQEVVLVTGDTAWLYDLNGLHVQPFPANLRVVVIDNAGGQIFRWLPGPASVGLTEPYFAAPPTASLEATADLHRLHFAGRATTEAEWIQMSRAWLEHSGPSLLIADLTSRE